MTVPVLTVDRLVASTTTVLAHAMDEHTTVPWNHLAELFVVGAAFLAGMALIGHRSSSARRSGPPGWVRWATVAALFVSATAHVPMTPAHLEEAPYMGVLFILYTAVAFAIAAVLAARPGPRWYAAGGALAAAAIAMYSATRLVAFPSLGDDVGHWTEPLGLVAVGAEAVVVALAAVALWRYVDQSRSLPLRR